MCVPSWVRRSQPQPILSLVHSQVDGEVESFERLPVAKVAEAVADGRFKPNCNLVIVDFLVRHGYLQPEDPGYVPLVHSLRRLLSD